MSKDPNVDIEEVGDCCKVSTIAEALHGPFTEEELKKLSFSFQVYMGTRITNTNNFLERKCNKGGILPPILKDMRMHNPSQV